MKGNKTYFSLFQEGDYLETGKNSKTKKEAINAAVDYVTGSNMCSAPSKLKRMSLQDKEAHLSAAFDIEVDEHSEPLPDEDDVEESDYRNRGTQRSPFGPGS